MPVEFIGLISTNHASEIHGGDGPLIDRAYVRKFARAHEESDFDRVLVGYSSSSPDGLQVAAYAAAHTERLGYLIAHRPGFVFPTVAARAFTRGSRRDKTDRRSRRSRMSTRQWLAPVRNLRWVSAHFGHR